LNANQSIITCLCTLTLCLHLLKLSQKVSNHGTVAGTVTDTVSGTGKSQKWGCYDYHSKDTSSVDNNFIS